MDLQFSSPSEKYQDQEISKVSQNKQHKTFQCFCKQLHGVQTQ